jgi:hypothetical protein
MDQLKESHGLVVEMISQGSRPYYADYDEKFQAVLGKVVEDYYKEVNEIESFWEGKRYLILDISASTADGDAAITPCVRYMLNK